MSEMLLPILIALAVALAAFGVAQAVGLYARGERRKLRKRLSTMAGDAAPIVAQHRSITIQQELGSLSGALVRWSFFANLHGRLAHAYPEMPLARFLTIAGGAGFGLFAMTLIVTESAAVSLVAAGVGLYIPFVWLSHKRARRQKLLSDQLPDALDFLGRILKAGHSLSTGLQMMGSELPQPLAGEFQRAYDQHSVGQSLEDALKDMARRIESTDFAFFVTAVLVQRQTGGDLSEVLGNISDMIRQRIRLQQHVKAKTAEGRFTGYILSAFPAVMFVIAYALNPDYAGVLLKTDTGLKLLGVAVGLQLLGLYFIKRITTVKV